MSRASWGARLFFLIQYRNQVFRDANGLGGFLKAALNFADGGMVLYGGVLLGIVVYLWFCRKWKIPSLLLADLVIPAIFLGLAFGRLGCLLNGCCFGDVLRAALEYSISSRLPPLHGVTESRIYRTRCGSFVAFASHSDLQQHQCVFIGGIRNSLVSTTGHETVKLWCWHY